MNKEGVFKGLDCLDLFNKIFKEAYSVSDVPFSIRKNELNELSDLPFKVENDDESLIKVDKFYHMFATLSKVNKDILKHLTILMAQEIKECNLPADFIIIRNNKIILIEFCYELISNNDNSLKAQHKTYVMNTLENTLKRYLPVDTVVKSYLFNIRKGNNIYEIDRLVKMIESLYSTTTIKELNKLIK